jgi:hypothetical protein
MSKTQDQLVEQAEDIRQVANAMLNRTRGGPIQVIHAFEQIGRMTMQLRDNIKEMSPEPETPPEPEPTPEPEVTPTLTPRQELEALEKDELIQVAIQIGVGANKRWGVEKIINAIEERREALSTEE